MTLFVERGRLERILVLALPIIGGMVSQNVLNLVDTAMVGTLGDAALAAVGIGGFANFVAMSLLLGISVGVQATSSRRKGEGRMDEVALPLNEGLLILLLAAPLMTVGLYQLVPIIYPYINPDPEVIRHGVPYLQVRVLAILFVGMNFAFRGYWNAVDMSKLYMGTLLVMHSVNIFLNWVFIFGNLGAPALGAEGAGLATSLSVTLGTAIYFGLGWKHARANGFLQGLPGREEVFRLIRLSLPNSIQNLFFAAGFLTLYWIVGKVGTPELAAANVLINVMLVAVLPALGLGLAASTLVGQALGRGDPEDAAAWGWDVTRVAIIGLLVLGIPMWLVPDLVLGVFLHDPATLELARIPMRLVGILMAVEGVLMVTMHSLLGAGDTGIVMRVGIGLQWFLFLPLAYLIGPVLGFGLLGIWILQGGYRGLMAMTFAHLWHRGTWADTEV
jgi:putative MATE family efflux protein